MVFADIPRCDIWLPDVPISAVAARLTRLVCAVFRESSLLLVITHNEAFELGFEVCQQDARETYHNFDWLIGAKRVKKFGRFVYRLAARKGLTELMDLSGSGDNVLVKAWLTYERDLDPHKPFQKGCSETLR